MDPKAIAQAIDAQLPLAETIFHDLEVQTGDEQGITRPAWSPQDQYAADLVADAARSLALEVAYDPVGNLYAPLPGRDRSAPGLLTGSHLDSVPKGGNYDGAAGVVAGLTALAALMPVANRSVARRHGQSPVNPRRQNADPPASVPPGGPQRAHTAS